MTRADTLNTAPKFKRRENKNNVKQRTKTKGKLNLPFVIIAPLCSENTWFDVFERLQLLVEEIDALPFADCNRICIMGASMGGYATWQLAMSMPERFAAIVPICGGGMYWNAGRLADIPVWAFHGAKDSTVYLEESALHRPTTAGTMIQGYPSVLS